MSRNPAAVLSRRTVPCPSSDEGPADPVSVVLTVASIGADTSLVEDHKSVEDWADALLEQHRATPGAGRGGSRADHNSLDRDPLMMRLLVKLSSQLSGEPPDPEMLERVRRSRQRFRAFQRIETVGNWIVIVVLCVFVYILFSNPFT